MVQIFKLDKFTVDFSSLYNENEIYTQLLLKLFLKFPFLTTHRALLLNGLAI